MADLFEALGAPRSDDQSPVVSVPPDRRPLPDDNAPLFGALGADPATAVAKQQQTPPPPLMPTAGPSGSGWTDWPRRIGSAFADAAASTVTPLLRARYGPQTVPGPVPTTPEQARANAINTMGGTYYQPETMGGRLFQSGLSSGIQGITNPASIPASFAGGATSQLAQEALPPDAPDWLRTLVGLPAFMAGAKGGQKVANLAVPPAGGVTPVPGSPSTQLPGVFPPPPPPGIDPTRAALAQRAADAGIELGAGNLSGSRFIKYLRSAGAVIPFSGSEAAAERQQGQFNRAVSQTFGEDADKITSDVIDGAHTRIGNVFERVANNTNVPMDNQLMADLQTAQTNARLQVPDNYVGNIDANIDHVINTAANNNGILSGTQYLNLTKRGGPIDSVIQNPNTRSAGIALRQALDDALERHAQPADVADLQTARAQYKALKTVEPLTVRADAAGGPTPSTGDISPAALLGSVRQTYGVSPTARAPVGAIPLKDFAQIGQLFLKEPPESGTAPREMIQHGLGTLGQAGAFLFGGKELGMDALHSALAFGGTALANRIVQGALRSQLGANRMVRAAQNPGGFQFSMPGVAQLPFSLAAGQ